MRFRRPIAIRQSRRAISILELLIASTLTLILMIAVLSLFVEMLRLEQSNSRQLAMVRDASDLSRELRQIASGRGRVVNDLSFLAGSVPATADAVIPHDEVPTFIQWDRKVGANVVTSELLVRDIDGDPTTIGDNSLVLVADVANPTNLRFLNYVSPLETTGVVTWDTAFGRPAPPVGTTYENAPIEIRLRIGDRVFIRDRAARRANAQAVAEDRWTGPSFESIVINTVYATRDE